MVNKIIPGKTQADRQCGRESSMRRGGNWLYESYCKFPSAPEKEISKTEYLKHRLSDLLEMQSFMVV